MESSDLVTVYTLTDAVRAEMIENSLRDEGIRCFLEGEEAVANLGIAPFEIRVMVPAADADQARKLIELHERRTQRHQP
jgi:hypothetical protein